ncbi:MAG: hypothetical protein HY926_13085 [Elusimicrobia bacterium]|nr:hypothetical protein [Elusimicrobiota bacterium]
MRQTLSTWLLLLPMAAAAQTEPASGVPSLLKRLEDRVAKLEGAPAKTSLSAFNPALGLLLDLAYTHGDGQRDSRSRFRFRTAELNIEAPIDPFLKGWAVVNANPDEVEVEEAALETTSLPYNLTVRGGRLFAAFGRMGHFHDDEIPVVDRPRSLDTFIGGEARADGVELSYLFPTDLYLNATAGLYNKVGGENGRADNAVSRPLDHFTYLGRLSTYLDLGDDHSVELGASVAWTPKRFVMDTSVPGDADGDGFPGDGENTSAGIETKKNTWRTLGGVDLTYRWHPTKGGKYQGMVWGTEVFQNDERRFAPATKLPTDRVKAYAGYSYVWLKVGPRWRPGVMVDLSEDLDEARKLTRTFSGFVTYDFSEFHRLRLVYSHQMNNVPGNQHANIVSLQWTGILGHHVHGFRDR